MWTVPPPNVNSPLSPVTSYILFLSEQQFNISTVVTNVSVNTHTFTGLEEFNRYTCIIAATNSIGQGPFTSPLIFNTSQAGMFQSKLMQESASQTYIQRLICMWQVTGSKV